VINASAFWRAARHFKFSVTVRNAKL